MKNIMIMLIISIFMISFVSALEVPNEPNTIVLNKIDAEHKNTRQFLAKELDNKVKENLNEFTKRADYYEQRYQEITTKMIFNLGLMFGGIYLFLMMANNLMNTRKEKRKFALMKEQIEQELFSKLSSQQPQQISQPQQILNPVPVPVKIKKKGFFKRRKERKELEKYQKLQMKYKPILNQQQQQKAELEDRLKQLQAKLNNMV